MITFVTGKPGDGKSMYGMQLIARSLLESDRYIVTNIPVKVPELRAYVVAKGYEGELSDRLKIIGHEDVFEFYRHRSGGYVLPPSPDWEVRSEGEYRKKLSRQEFISRMQEQLDEMKKHPEALLPCEYHIDEAHDYFSAREWADTGHAILWYASKHRHLHDEIVLYTQVMANVEKQLRGVASETVRVRNQMRMRWGPFRKAPIFRVFSYYGAPEKTESSVPFASSVMTLDREGLASTYNSAGALNVHRKPETIKNKAPLPYWALPVAACVLVAMVVVLFALAPVTLGKFAGKKMAQSVIDATGAKGSASRFLVGGAARPAVEGVPAPQSFSPASAGAKTQPAQPARAVSASDRLEGWTLGRRGPVVWLSSGRVLHARDIDELGDDYVTLRSGETVYERTPEEKRAHALEMARYAQQMPQVDSLPQPVPQPPPTPSILPGWAQSVVNRESGHEPHQADGGSAEVPTRDNQGATGARGRGV